MSGNVAYLAQRLPFGESEIEDIYHQKKNSMGASLVQILDNYIALGVDPIGPGTLPVADEQAKNYPWVPAKYMSPTFRLTSNRQQAIELINILADYYEKPAYLTYDVRYNLASPTLDIETGNKNEKWSSIARNVPVSSSTGQRSSQGFVNSSVDAMDLLELRNHTFQTAGATYKKGGLYRSAAAVFSERGRELNRDIQRARSTQAAHYVDERSTPDQIDLHGVTVQDGVSIALDRVWRWWDSLGEERTRKAKEGFTIVTGVGKHSAGGVSRLRVNVFKALVADGWKITVLTGQYLVTGRK
jgi:hypothetical protein